jgi:hypothetical protein
LINKITWCTIKFPHITGMPKHEID